MFKSMESGRYNLALSKTKSSLFPCKPWFQNQSVPFPCPIIFLIYPPFPKRTTHLDSFPRSDRPPKKSSCGEILLPSARKRNQSRFFLSYSSLISTESWQSNLGRGVSPRIVSPQFDRRRLQKGHGPLLKSQQTMKPCSLSFFYSNGVVWPPSHPCFFIPVIIFGKGRGVLKREQTVLWAHEPSRDLLQEGQKDAILGED